MLFTSSLIDVAVVINVVIPSIVERIGNSPNPIS